MSHASSAICCCLIAAVTVGCAIKKPLANDAVSEAKPHVAEARSSSVTNRVDATKAQLTDQPTNQPAADSASMNRSPSLSQLTVDLETLKQQSPSEFAALREMFAAGQDALPAQYQQLWQNQMRSVVQQYQQTPQQYQQTPQPQVPPTLPMPNTASHNAPPQQLAAATPNAAPLPPQSSPPRPAPSETTQTNEPETGSTEQFKKTSGSAEVAESSSKSAESQNPEIEEDTPGHWRDQVAGTLEALRTELRRPELDRDEALRLEISRRLLHVVNNDREAAVAAIDKLEEDEREFWKHQIYGLMVLLDADGKHASSRRAALGLRELREATNYLANISTLDLKNLALCSEVVSYGVFTEFDSYTFRPGDEVVLYVEVDNFAAHPNGKGGQFETELRGSYEIRDESGNRVANVVLPDDRQLSKNRRRDYFIPYLITLPEQIESGSYRLRLTIEDVIGKKSNQASLDFRIR